MAGKVQRKISKIQSDAEDEVVTGVFHKMNTSAAATAELQRALDGARLSNTPIPTGKFMGSKKMGKIVNSIVS